MRDIKWMVEFNDGVCVYVCVCYENTQASQEIKTGCIGHVACMGAHLPHGLGWTEALQNYLQQKARQIHVHLVDFAESLCT